MPHRCLSAVIVLLVLGGCGAAGPAATGTGGPVADGAGPAAAHSSAAAARPQSGGCISSEAEALAIARAMINSAGGADMVILEDKTVERSFGWVFFYTTRRYLETGDPNDLSPGNGPVIVERDGSALFMSTSVDPEQGITDYEADHRHRPPSPCYES